MKVQVQVGCFAKIEQILAKYDGNELSLYRVVQDNFDAQKIQEDALQK